MVYPDLMQLDGVV